MQRFICRNSLAMPLMLLMLVLPLAIRAQDQDQALATLVAQHAPAINAAASPAEAAERRRELARLLRNTGTGENTLIALLLEQRADADTALADQLQALEKLGTGPLTPESYQQTVALFLLSASDLFDTGYVSARRLARFNTVLAGLDKWAESLGLPKIDEIASETGGPKAEKLLKMLVWAENLGNSLDDRGREETAAHLDKRLKAFTDLVPATLLPASTILPFVRGNIRWTRQMFDNSSEGLDIVRNAIASGQVDRARLEKLLEQQRRLQKGPWGVPEVQQFFLDLCAKLPAIGPFCKDLFASAGDALSQPPAVCRKIDCNCDGIEAGLLTGPWRQQCRQEQADLLARCVRDGAISGRCITAGPGAFPN